ncbi:hypothetical protein QC760_001293 [Botrytis cinerea]
MQISWPNFQQLVILFLVFLFVKESPPNKALSLEFPTNFTLSPLHLRTYLPRFAHIHSTRTRRTITINHKMAWTCSGRTNAELINNMWNAGLIHSERIREAMISVDRAHYTPSESLAYEDSPQSIGHQATISAPHMHASALEYLLPYLGEGKRVLDVGSGSGYLTAVMAELVLPSSYSHSSRRSPAGAEAEAQGRKWKVVGLEHIRALRDMGETNVMKSEEGKKWLREKNVEFVVGDGREGWKGSDEEEGWDAIHVGAAAKEIHEALIEQLRSPGRMFIPVEDSQRELGGQHIWVVDKDGEGKVSKEKLYGNYDIDYL